VELTAARANLDDDWLPTDEWRHLVGQFMLQAVVEEYLRNGAFGDDSFNTIFAFGNPGNAVRPDEGSDIQAMRKVFCDAGDPPQQVNSWSRIKQHYIDEVS
jgi:hypothetical protein